MAYTTNRMEDNWLALFPLLQQEWPELNAADLDYVNMEYDRLVEVIRERCGGRANIIQEAAIRDRLNRIIHGMETD